MIVHNLNVKEIISINVEANAVLNIDTNAILSLTITMQQFQVIRWRNSQILQTSCIVDHHQFPQCNTLYVCGNFFEKIWLYTFSVSLSTNSLSYIYIIPVLRAHVKQVYDLFFLMLFFVRLRTPSYK